MEKITDEELICQVRERLEEHSRSIDELREMTAELRQLNSKLEQSENLKSHFISNISNELINPLASIMALAREIMELKGKQDWKMVETMVNLIHSETFNLDFQLRNIFAAARIEAGEIHPEISRVNINSLLVNTIDLFLIETQKRNITINCHFDFDGNEIFEFNTDPAKLKLIICNFLSNSVKFSSPGSIINIRLSKINDNNLKLTVEDFGIGIKDEFKSEIYDRFKKIDETINSVTRGNGLGLSINKAFVDVLGGTIDFESKLGQGTTFNVILPESDKDVNSYSDGGNDFFFEDELVV